MKTHIFPFFCVKIVGEVVCYVRLHIVLDVIFEVLISIKYSFVSSQQWMMALVKPCRESADM